MRDQDPVFYDALFRQKRKGGKWRVMPSPVLEGPVADSHAHLQMLADPACELARAGAHGVAFVETIVDPAEDGFATFDVLPLWLMEAARDLKVMEEEDDGAAGIVAAPAVPHVRIAAGVHPHNAKEWAPELKAALRERLRDRRVSAVGEIGLDYHYDLSPRETQREVFRAQIRLAKEAEKFHRPIITFVDTSGAYPGKGAEERLQQESDRKADQEGHDLVDHIFQEDQHQPGYDDEI